MLGNNLKGNLIIGTKEEEIVKIVLLYLLIISVSFVTTFKVLTLNTRPHGMCKPHYGNLPRYGPHYRNGVSTYRGARRVI